MSPSTPIPPVGALITGPYLRTQRHRHDISLRQAGHALGLSPSQISRMETGGSSDLTAHRAVMLLTHYGIRCRTCRDTITPALHPLAVKDPAHYGDDAPGWSIRYALCQRQANHLTYYAATHIPAPWRTPAYAAHIPPPEDPHLTHGADHDPLAQLPTTGHTRRKPNRDDLLLLDEAVLHRATAPPAVMAEQLTALARAASERHLTLRVVPLEAGIPVAASTITAITTTHGHTLYATGSCGITYTTAGPAADAARGLLDALTTAAWGPSVSIAKLATTAERLRGAPQPAQ